MSERKPVKKQELQVDIAAPLESAWKALTEAPGLANWFAPIAEVSAPGAGAIVKNGWSEEMMMTSTVQAWEPLRHVGWFDDSGWMGPGTALGVDYYLSTEKGATRVRLVQSAFGESGGWDGLFDGTKVGWTYFLYNLKAYLERHAGRTRRLINERLPVKMPRHAFWERLLSPAGGFVLEGQSLGDAVIEVRVEDHGLGLRFPKLDNSLLFIELEGKGDEFHVGWWLSVYDEALAKRLDAPARAAFRRVHDNARSA